MKAIQEAAKKLSFLENLENHDTRKSKKRSESLDMIMPINNKEFENIEKKPLIFVWLDSNELQDREKALEERKLRIQQQLDTYVPIIIQRKGIVILSHVYFSAPKFFFLIDLSIRGNNRITNARIFARHMAYRKPVVYQRIARRLIKNYEVLYDLERLRHEFGQYPVSVTLMKRFESEPPFRKESTTLGEYISSIMASPEYASSHYLQQLNLDKYIPDLIKIAEISFRGPNTLCEYITEGSCNGPTFFIGARGTRTSLHFDRTSESKFLASNSATNMIANAAMASGPSSIKSSPPRVSNLSNSYPGRPPSASFSTNTNTTATTTATAMSSVLSFPLSTSSASTHSSSIHSQTSSLLGPPPSSSDPFHRPTHHLHNPPITPQLTQEQLYKKKQSFKDSGKHNLFLQLSGSRRFILFPPRFYDDLLPLKGSPWPNVSKSSTFVHTVFDHSLNHHMQMEFILNSPYPSLAKAWPYRIEVLLEAGETLFIPAQWWYCTMIVASGVAVNWWFLVDHDLEDKIRKIKNEDWEPVEQNCVIS